MNPIEKALASFVNAAKYVMQNRINGTQVDPRAPWVMPSNEQEKR